MESHRHFTTRRAFIGAMGFGALGLYGTWAAIGASPLPFAGRGEYGDPLSHVGHDGHSDPQMHETHGASAMSPEQFERRHADFLKQFRQADGSVRPSSASAQAANMDDMPGMETMQSVTHGEHVEPMKADGHEASATVEMPEMAGMRPSDMAGKTGMSHGAQDAPEREPAQESQAADSHPMTHGSDTSGHEEHKPVEVFLSATRWSFEPDNLQLEVGRPYRFYMMATDIAHGASIAFGPASRIVRLRPGTVTTLDLTFLTTGRRLVYCTVYCGPGHDAMHGAITVA
jgi:hypothetical protein